MSFSLKETAYLVFEWSSFFASISTMHKPYIGTWSIDAQRAVQIAQCIYGWTRKKDPYSDPMSGDGFSPHA